MLYVPDNLKYQIGYEVDPFLIQNNERPGFEGVLDTGKDCKKELSW